MKSCQNIIFANLLFLTTASFSHNALADNRTEHRFGFYGSLLGDPYPSAWGINLAANAASFLRVNFGYGSVTGTVTATSGSSSSSVNVNISTVGAGAKLMVPDWNFTPVVGFNWAQVTVNVTGGTPSTTLDGFSASASHTYLTFGFDWQASTGFNIGAGFNQSLLAGVQGLPYLNLGWFF